MTTAYSSLLGFALPQTGDLSGTWGDTVNNSVTQLVEDSVAGVATQSVAGGDWTLTDTGIGLPNQARCAILIPTGSPGAPRNIVAPSRSKAYFVINQSNNTVTVKGGATTGVTLAVNERAVVAWSGSDFVKVASSVTGVTSVGLTMPTGFTVSGSPVTTSGTLAVSTTLSGVLKGTGSGITAATPGSDYAPPTSGASILYGNNAGGFNNVTIGSNLSFVGGVLSASGSTGVTGVFGAAPIVSSGGATPTISLQASGVSAGTYSNPTLSVDTYGRITSITGGGSGPVTSVNVNAPIVNTGSASAPVIGIDLTNIVTTNTTQTITAAKGHTAFQSFGISPGDTGVSYVNTPLYAYGSSFTGTSIILDSGASGQGCMLAINRTGISALIVFGYGPGGLLWSEVGRIYTNGSIVYYKGQLDTSSDYRLKEEIEPFVGGIDKLKRLKPKTFLWKDRRWDYRVGGFLAHELEDVIPNGVTGRKDGVDKDGKPEYQGIDPTSIIPTLTAALQEAVAKIEALEARVKALGG